MASDPGLLDRPAALEGAMADAVEALREAGTVVVTGHVNPDGDALGSLLALTAALDGLGITAIPAWGSRDPGEPPAPVDPAWSFLPLLDRVAHPDDVPAAPDVVLACDSAAAHRLGTLSGVLDGAGTVVVVDHHAVGEAFGDIRVVDPTASSTGVLALRLIDALGAEVTSAIADALYLAVLTDTGRFGFAATTPDDHRVAARLLEAGADHVGIARAVYESASPGFLTLVSRVTGRARVDDRMVCSWVSIADVADTGAGDTDVDGLIDLLRKVESADVTCLLRETAAGAWRTSLRSRGAVDVAAVAQGLGGGGHRMAAGFTGHGDVEDVIAAVAARLRGLPS
ncbi:bifunctional oligoribonuclease/PAP phosphatase NrnA [Euzebya sp.]|uniref:DHH family phosphoesterase n=1 Tax=Euzebya sp. TaxID=1971409 RepID=UPI0035128CFD